jgi:Sec7-like guanine-nucleotide exchange factor
LQVGEWLGNHDELAVATMRAYIDAEHFGGMPIDAALRQLLSRFRLPGRYNPNSLPGHGSFC